MSLKRTFGIAVVAMAMVCLLSLGVRPSAAAPLAAQTAEDRAAVESAVARYQAALAQAERVHAQVADASAELDDILADQAQAQARLSARVSSMYRADDTDALSILFGATTVTDFFARIELLMRMAEDDAAILSQLKIAQAAAQQTAEELLDLQTQAAKAVDATEAEMVAAQAELADSEAALREYEARAAAAKASAASQAASTSQPEESTPPKSDPTQELHGSGEWQTGVASHYSRTFTGRSASGEEIGPYSMIVAHKTLPFGTLIEFEYDGKRAVARVADRGPFVDGRDFDLGPGVVRALDFSGVHEVRYRIISQ